MEDPQNLNALPATTSVPEPALARVAPPPEDPPWSIWDVILIGGVTLAAIFFFALITVLVVQHWFFRQLSLAAVGQKPILNILAQAIAYVLFFLVVYLFLRLERKQPFFSALSWNWPRGRSWAYVLLGVGLSLVLGLCGRVLPMPKDPPILELFKTLTPLQAALISLFSVTLGPWVEEFFFRGFMYPALARPLGREAAASITATLFALPHALQLGALQRPIQLIAWTPVVLIFIVGVVLVLVRAISKSLAACVLVHMAYNGTIAAVIAIQTDFYRHMEKLN